MVLVDLLLELPVALPLDVALRGKAAFLPTTVVGSYKALMPSLAERCLEDDSIRGLCEELSARGRPSRILSKPEDDPDDPLTVDALIEIGGERWAVDHLRLTFDKQGVAARRQAENVLRPPLDALSEQYGVGLAVSVLPVVGSPGEAWGQDYYASVVELARSAIQSGGDVFADDGFTSVQLDLTTAGVRFLHFLASDPSISTQVETAVLEPVEKKLSGQLARAKQAGLRTILLLNQCQPEDTEQPSAWMGSPQTVSAAVQPLLDHHPGIADQIWLEDSGGSFHLLMAG